MEEELPDINIEDIEDDEINIYNISLLKEDKILIVFEEEGNYNDYICLVTDFITENEQKYIIITTEFNQIYKLETDLNDFILKDQTDNTIIDIEKIIEFDLDELEDVVNINLTKDIYPEILLDIEEKLQKEYIFTETDKKESLLSELISSLDIYDNELLMKKITSMVDVIFNMINEDLDLSEYEKILINNVFPNWIIPISNNLKRYYIETDNEELLDINYENIIIKKQLKHEINSQFVHLLTENEEDIMNFTYQKIISNIYANLYSPIQEYDFTNGYLLQNYNGEYYLDCFANNCINVDGFLNVDNRKTRNELSYNTIVSDKNEKVILIQKENINLSGFFFLPNQYNYLNCKMDLDNELFTLGEIILINNIKYTIFTKNELINKIMNENKVNKFSLTSDLEDIDINYKNFNIFMLNDNFNKERLLSIFNKYIQKELDIFKSIDKYILNYIFNYTDLKKIFINYTINLQNIDNNLKNIVNKIIDININRYSDLYDDFKLNKEKYKTKKKLTINEKIYFIKNFIYTQSIIPIKNIYIKKLINKYSREPKGDAEDPNFLYNIHDNNKLICKHHLFSTNVTDDKSSYDSLINNFATPPKDGSIYCKFCSEFIDFEKKSIYQGFDEDNKPIQMSSLSEEIDEDIFINITKEQKKTKDLIELISNKINIYLTDIDKKEIIDLYEVINNDLLANDRYEVIDVSIKNHPMISDEKNSKTIKILKYYLIYSNKLLFLFISILIYFQTAIPEYTTRNSIELNLLDLTTNKYKFIKEESNSDIISIKVVDYLINRIKVLTNKYRKDAFWKNIKIFLDEQKNPNIPGPREQIINTIKHILSSKYNNIFERIRLFKNFKELSNKLYFKNYWSSYKPLPTNINIKNINKLIIDKINSPEDKEIYFKNYDGTLYLENIALIKKINKNNYQDLYKELNIQISKIQNNSSFYKFVNYVNDLYGVHLDNKYFNNLIFEFLNSMNDPDLINLFNNYRWDNQNKMFRGENINFSELKKLISDIYDYYSSKNIDKISLFMYNYNIKNNVNLKLLNTKPKRIYTNNFPKLFSENTYDSTKNKESYDKIFEKYCYDYNNNLIVDIKTNIIISDDLKIDTKINICKNKETPNQKNFIKILNDIIKKNQFNYFNINHNYFKNENIYKVNSLISFINSNPNLMADNDIKNIYNYFTNYLDDLVDISEIYKESISKLFDTIIDYTNRINNYLITSSFIESTRKQEITNKTGPYNIKLNKINILLANIVKNGSIDTIKKYINIVKYTISRICNYKNLNHFNKLTKNVFHTITPKNWNLTDTNKPKLEIFLSEKEFLLHNLIYIEKNNKKIDNGFYEYLNDSDIDINYLQNIVNSYTKNINIINSNNSTYLDDFNTKLILSFSLMSIFIDIINYCDSIDEDDDISLITNILLDIILNIIQDFNDQRWIHSIDLDNINLNLSKQKEREKQNLLNEFDQMDGDERYAKQQLQNIGATNWYRIGEEKGEKYLESSAYADELEFERSKYLETIYNSTEQSQDVFNDKMDFSSLNPMDHSKTDTKGFNDINDKKYEDSEDHDSHEY